LERGVVNDRGAAHEEPTDLSGVANGVAVDDRGVASAPSSSASDSWSTRVSLERGVAEAGVRGARHDAGVGGPKLVERFVTDLPESGGLRGVAPLCGVA
jgi:hypothetical protein